MSDPDIHRLRTEIAELEEDLAAADRPRIRTRLETDLARLRADLTALEPRNDPPALNVNQSGQSGGKSAGAGNTFAGDVVIGDVTHIYQGADDGPDGDLLLDAYLRSLAGVCNRLSFADADSSDPTRAAVALAEIFTGLEVGRTITEMRDGREQTRPHLALEALALHPRLVLLGPPGSGKSTIANYVGLCLARARLAGADAPPDTLGAVWPHGALLPIRVILREFAAWLASRPPTRGSAETAILWDFLRDEKHLPAVLVARLRAEVSAGKVLLLLDGLDEVPAGAHGVLLRTVQEIIRDLAAVAASSRILVTCRELDYRAEGRPIPGWPEETIIPLAPALRRAFIDRWFAVLMHLERPLNGDPTELRDRLAGEIQSRPELSRLAGNPLLLTMMTLVHAYEGRLPDQRVRLYEKSIEFLLHRWRPARDERPLRDHLDLAAWSDSDLQTLLDRLGFAAHERGVSADGEAGSDLPENRLMEVASDFFRAYGEGAYRRAEVFATYITRHSNGVIQPFGPKVYRFPHRTFQEYLAARRLVGSGGWDDEERLFWQRALRRADAGPQWRETLLLAVSQLAVVTKDISPATELLHQLITRGCGVNAARAHDLALAGELLAEIGLPLLHQQSTLAAGLWAQARRDLAALIAGFDSPGATAVAPAERVRAGQALGLLDDPRIPVSAETWHASLQNPSTTFTAVGDHYWRYVPAGRYRMGGWKDGDASAEHDLTPFWIARLPITVAQFARFVAEGYREDTHWTPNGLTWRGDRTEPYLWSDPRFSGTNQPVTIVTWYEATAFCHWLTTHLAAVLPAHHELRLPTEAEWEVAAAYDGSTTHRTYPWGEEEATPERAVYDAWKLNTAAPVGLCPAGAAACGALDLAGNVWEWCASHHTTYPDAAHTIQKDFTVNDWDVPLRGGYWNSSNIRCEARGWDRPGNGRGDDGFRVVVSPVFHSR